MLRPMSNKIVHIKDTARARYIKDLLKIAKSDLFFNVKGYYQKLIDNLYEVGYYEDNESVISEFVKE